MYFKTFPLVIKRLGLVIKVSKGYVTTLAGLDSIRYLRFLFHLSTSKCMYDDVSCIEERRVYHAILKPFFFPGEELSMLLCGVPRREGRARKD